MSNNENIPDVPPEMTGSAVSVYGGQDGMEDFPVLKAFQQYVDAEQAKARKRMIQLCIFFAVLMAAVIGVFVLLVMDVSRRNQALNDRLVEYAMKDRLAVQQAAAPGSNGSDVAIKTMTESMAAFQKQMIEQQAHLAEQQMKLAEQAVKNATAAAEAARASAVAPVQPQQAKAEPSADDHAAAMRKAESEKLLRLQEKLRAEREALAKDKESLRLQEIELQRRRLYPELYDANGNLLPPKAAKKEEPTRLARRTVAPQPPVAEIEDEEEDDGSLDEIDAAIAKESKEVEESTALPDGGALTYFSDDNEPAAPRKQTPKAKPAPKQNENTSGWRIPLD